ncbi:Fur family transcriptional regulator [Parvibaculum sp.]|uniref:Fur family transcriptional regulator n=1 Tax=Parvibaculum sp. TaxID=2024848 RepID=UPI0027314950|nr:Fur family transcriptional regulator [Parvibaculum sp.]MDP1626831.1 Fur family transcriptional regulator [Parvibaculum sp.]MDP2148477.1 Fur family transcriptional regulator [Parvibaculum sp.]MDP3327005.1 Fur family transcriptional regulator [Parvibaculum sp.]
MTARAAHTSHNHRACIDDALATARALCDERGTQLTPLREKVLQIVWKSHKPVGAYDVLDELARSHKAARPPTVYRALDFLMAEGLIHKIESLNAYLGCIEAGAPHTGQFLICRNCGATEEIVDPKLETALEAAAARAHFKAERKIVEISGLCARCIV